MDPSFLYLGKLQTAPGIDVREIAWKFYGMKKRRIQIPKRILWTPPVSGRVGWKGLSAKQLRDAAFKDTDPRLN